MTKETARIRAAEISGDEDRHIFGFDSGTCQVLQELLQCQREAEGQVVGGSMDVRRCREEVMTVFKNLTCSLWLPIWVSLWVPVIEHPTQTGQSERNLQAQITEKSRRVKQGWISGFK